MKLFIFLILALRHTCEEGDKMKSYGWTRANGVDFFEQDIQDATLNLQLTTTFLKRETDHFGMLFVLYSYV
jgi:mannosyl-oligosaccharide glucosidase